MNRDMGSALTTPRNWFLLAAAATLLSLHGQMASVYAQPGGQFAPPTPPAASKGAPAPQVGASFPGLGGDTSNAVTAKPVSRQGAGVPDFGARQLDKNLSQMRVGQQPGGVGGGPLNVLNLQVGKALPTAGGRDVSFSGRFMIEKGSQRGILSVRAVLAPGFHIYSLTQPEEGPMRTTIDVVTDPPGQLEITRQFEPDKDPVLNPGLYPKPTEEHSGQVMWTAHVKLKDGVVAEDIKIKAIINGQICNEACEPIENKRVNVLFGGHYQQKKPTGEHRHPSSQSTVTGYTDQVNLAPGEKAKIFLTFKPDDTWYLYGLKSMPTEELGVGSATLIVVEKASGLIVGHAQPSSKAVDSETGPHYEGAITFVMDVEVPADAQPGPRTIAGIAGYQNCAESGTCTQPVAVKFTAQLNIGESKPGGAPLLLTAAKYKEAAEAAKERKKRAPKATSVVKSGFENYSLWVILALSFVGGLILNLMPCVLPVIGLKVLSFAQQAGESRTKIILLNVFYAAGMVAVFMVLASFAAFANLGWGEQFGYTWFKVAMAVLVFAMALSFLGVWEISIPSFFGGATASKLQSQSGLSGAFFKGMFTTVLATPCSGPFLGSAITWSVAQPPLVTYLVFACVGLGMASPYLLLGAFPSLIAFVPKPGEWMETFKQFLAFVLLATVVYLFSTITTDYHIATLALMVGVWFACWWVGRLSFTMSAQMRSAHWVSAAATAALVGIFAFMWLTPAEHKLPWQPYSPAALAQARAEGKTVLVEFTADWCPNCKWNMATAIDTDNVKKVVDENEVVTLLADYTERTDVIKRQLEELNSKSIPLLAVFPAGKPDAETIVLREIITESQVIGAIKEAGPSLDEESGGAESSGSAGSTATAMKASGTRGM